MSKSMKNILIKNKPENSPIKSRRNESGFSLIEVTIALVVLLVAVLGIFATFTYATIYNGGNSRRSQALSIFQKEIELLRSAKFTPTTRDTSLAGGTRPPRIETNPVDGFSYLIEIKVDDDPFTTGNQIDDTKTLKEITLKVTPQNINGSWVIAFPTSVVFRRVRAN